MSSGQSGRVPVILTLNGAVGSIEIRGGGPGGLMPGGRMTCQPKILKSSHRRHVEKNHRLQGMIAPSSVGSGSSTDVVIGSMKSAAVDELEVVDEGGEVIGPGVNVVISPSEFVRVMGVEIPVGTVMTPLVSEMMVCPSELVVVVGDGGAVVSVELLGGDKVEDRPEGTNVNVSFPTVVVNRVVIPVGNVTASSVLEMTVLESELTIVVSLEGGVVDAEGVNVNVWPLDVKVMGVLMPVGMVKVASELVMTVSPFEFVETDVSGGDVGTEVVSVPDGPVVGDGVNVNVWSPEVTTVTEDIPVGIVNFAPELVIIVCPFEFVVCGGPVFDVVGEPELLPLDSDGVNVNVWSPDVMTTGVVRPVGITKVAPELVTIV